MSSDPDIFTIRVPFSKQILGPAAGLTAVVPIQPYTCTTTTRTFQLFYFHLCANICLICLICRDQHMTGWTYKEITQEDLKFPVVYGEGKRSRLLATIGVTRCVVLALIDTFYEFTAISKRILSKSRCQNSVQFATIPPKIERTVHLIYGTIFFRGFGDHDLKAQSQNGFVYIKPFLTPQPGKTELECILLYFLSLSNAHVGICNARCSCLSHMGR